MNKKQLDSKLTALGYDLGRFANNDTRRLDEYPQLSGAMPDSGWRWKVSQDGRIVFKAATLAGVELYLEVLTRSIERMADAADAELCLKTFNRSMRRMMEGKS